MTRLTRRNGLVIMAMLAAAALAGLATGCTDQQTTTTTVASPTTSTTGSATMMQMIVEGDTVQQYEEAAKAAEEELPALQKAVEASPNDLAKLQDLASAQWLTKRYAEAAATYEKMLQRPSRLEELRPSQGPIREGHH
jgi:thioredoxin-like negative regulator of GroEL